MSGGLTFTDYMTGLAALMGAIGSVIRWVHGRFEAERVAREKAVETERLAREQDRHDMRDLITVVSNTLLAFKEQVAREHPSYARLEEIMQPIRDGIDDLKGDMRRLIDRGSD